MRECAMQLPARSAVPLLCAQKMAYAILFRFHAAAHFMPPWRAKDERGAMSISFMRRSKSMLMMRRDGAHCQRCYARAMMRFDYALPPLCCYAQ